MATVYVSSRTATLSSESNDVFYIQTHGILTIEQGGAILSDGSLYVFPLGSAIVNSGGRTLKGIVYSSAGMTVRSGGTATGVQVYGDGRLDVMWGGHAADVTLSSGGWVYVSRGTLYGIQVSGGTLELKDIDPAAPANSSFVRSAILNYGGIMNVGSKAVAYLTQIKNGGEMNVRPGGYASSTEVSSGGKAYVSGSARLTTLYGSMYVSSGGFASATTVGEGGFMRIGSGTVASATVASGGSVEIAGSSYDGVYSGANVLIYHHGSSVNEVFSGGTLSLNEGDVANASFGSGAAVRVYDGSLQGRMTGSNISVTQTGGFLEISDMNDLAADVSSGGFWASSGTIRTANISGGSVNLLSGAILSSAYLVARPVVTEGAHLNIMNGGVVSSATVQSGGSIDITSNGKLIGGSVFGTLSIEKGGVASNVQICSGGTFFNGGVIHSVNVEGAASMFVSSGGSVGNLTAKGPLAVLSGGVVSSAVLRGSATVFGRINYADVSSGGSTVISAGGSISSANIYSSGIVNVYGGVLSSASVGSKGLLRVSSGGSVLSGTVNGSALVVYSGSAMRLTVGSGGFLRQSGGAMVRDTLVTAGGSAEVALGPFVGGRVRSGGIVTVSSEGTADTCIIESGGLMRVSKGGECIAFSVRDGGRITGYYDCTGASFASGSIADFDLAMTTADAATELVVNLASAANADFTLTVKDSQANGTYKLATGANGFNKTITVKNTAGTDLGTLAVGRVTDIGGVGYKLALGGDNVLSVTVGAVEPEPTAFAAKSDVDGNSISDVMFQYTGGDYQLGFWMNGTNEWKGNGLQHPAEWEVLGAYDMNSNGKADAVLFGNVTSEAGVHGAYIGYYADSDDFDSNWVNIGYLTNEDNIDWKNKVGNLTGNSGKNSIVWYTYELGALGVWTDGTESWVSMCSGFDATWTLIGCGDFDGDGKDAVVMAHNSGEEYHAIDIAGMWTNLGASDSGWEVRAIGDFKGDGKDDIVAFHNETGIVAMWGDGNIANWSQLGQLDASDWFVVGTGDYDADAKDDLLVRQKSTGMLGYYASGDMANWNTLGYGVDMSWTVIA